MTENTVVHEGFVCFSTVKSNRLLLPLLVIGALPCPAEQLWLGRSMSVHATEALRITISNTAYIEHEKHFANEEAASFRWRFADNWSAGAGITFSQDRGDSAPTDPDSPASHRHGWNWSARPTEHISFDWLATYGDWTLSNAQRFDLKFREGERDWVVYRNIGSVTAPPIPRLPWSPRPFLTQQIYISSRECFTGLDRFSQFRWGAGIRLAPLENLRVSAYWQYRDIEQPAGDWTSFRIAGLSAALVF